MKNRVFSVLCILAVVLVFVATANTSTLSWIAGAEDTTSATTKKSSDPEPYEDPVTSATSATQPPMPTTSSTTKKEEESTSKTPESSSNPTSATNPTNPTEPTVKPPTSEKEGTDKSEPASDNNSTTKTPGTTKGNGKTTTTRRSSSYTPTPVQTTVPHMTVPKVDNTTIEGTTIDPLSAWFERISGDSNTYPTYEIEQTQAAEPEDNGHTQLPTIAIVAICIGGIALVTVILTAAFAIRNKRAADNDGSDDGTENDVYEAYENEAYDAPQTTGQQDAASTKVDESDSFTVVSLDDKDYKD